MQSNAPTLRDGASYTSIGIVIAISGNVLISLALNIQKYAHKHLHEARSYANGSNSHSTSSSNDTSPTIGLSRQASSSILDRDQTFAETRPLLPRISTEPTPPQGYGAGRSKKLFNLPRINLSWGSKPPEPSLRSPDAPNGALDIDHHDDDELDENSKHTESDYLRSKMWWLGFILMNIGEIGNFLSYAYAPASLVAPLGTVALVANCFFAPLLLHERFRKRDIFGIVLAVIGSITIVLSSKPTDIRLSPDALAEALSQPLFIGYTILNILGVIFLSILSHSNVGREHIFIDVGICALFGGYTVLATKGVSTLLSLRFIQIFKLWITYPLIIVLLGTGVGQIRYLNRALMRFDSKHVIPTQFVMFNLTAIIGSAILYRDFENISLHKMISFIYGVLTVFAAIFIFTYSPPVDSSETPLVALDDPIAVLTSPISSTATEQPERGTAVTIAGGNRYVLRTKASTSNLGISPGQYLLLAASPPNGEGSSRMARDTERNDYGSLRGSHRRRSMVVDGHNRSQSPNGGAGRRRTIQFDSDPAIGR